MGRRWGRGGHAVCAKGAGSGEDPTPEPVGSGPPHQDFGLLDCRTCRLNFCHFKVILCGNLLQGVLSRKRKFCTWNVACSRGLGEVQLVGMVPGIFWLLPCSLERSYFPDAEGGVLFFFFSYVHWPFLLCGLLITYHTLLKVFIFIYVWLHRVLEVACRIFSCGTWDLIPQPGIEPRPPALGAQRLSHWATRDIPEGFFSECLLDAFLFFFPGYSLYEFFFKKHFF